MKQKQRVKNIYSISYKGVSYPSIAVIAGRLGMQAQTLVKRVLRSKTGDYSATINGGVLTIKIIGNHTN